MRSTTAPSRKAIDAERTGGLDVVSSSTCHNWARLSNGSTSTIASVADRTNAHFRELKAAKLLAKDKIGIKDVSLTPRQVWQIIREQLYGDDSVIVQGATIKQILGRFYRTRVNHFGREIYDRLETEPLRDVKHSSGL
jgi:hypothetical protein